MCVSAAVIFVCSGMSLSAQGQGRRPAAQSADPFVGTWILNPAKSTYEGLPAPKAGWRTFDYERDGMILCTADSTNDAGRHAYVHYLITLDEKPQEEVTRGLVKDPNYKPTYVSAKKLNDRAMDLTFSRDGKVIIWHSWTISEDGKTFTVKRKGTNAQGQPTFSHMVYDKQE
jgi:hypothetical protein